MDLRGNWASVCPALLCNPRRNQVAPMLEMDRTCGTKFIAPQARFVCIIPHGGAGGESKPSIEKPENLRRMRDHRIRTPARPGAPFPEIDPACGNDRHAGRSEEHTSEL